MLSSRSIAAASLARALENSPDCVKLVDLDGRLLWMNPNGLCALEIDDLHALKGKQWAELWPEDLQDNIRASLALAEQNGLHFFSAACPTAKGKKRWWDVSVYPVLDDAGEPAGYLSISRDVTAREMDRLTNETLLAEMRHRLKNSYTLLGGLIATLARGNKDREEFAREIQTRITALSKAQASFANAGSEAALGVLIAGIVTQFSAEYVADIQFDIPADIVVDRRTAEAIGLIIGEFAVNSAKYGALKKGGLIRVSTRQEHGSLDLTWDETLHGEVLAHSRVDGQGLALIRRMVDIRGGSFELDWRPNGLRAQIDLGRS